MDMIGVTRLSIYPDWMHDKNLGTDKATRAHTFLQIVLYTHLQQGWGSFCLTVVWMRGGRGSHTFFYRLSHTHLQQGWGSLSYSGLDEGGRGSEPVPQHPLVCYGSTMHLLVHVVMDGDAAENIKTVWAEARKEYVSLGIDRTNRFTNMHATMFKVTCLFFFHNRIALKGFVFNYTCLIRVCSSSWNLYSYHLFIYLSMYLFMYLSTHLSVNLRWLAYKLILHPEGERRVQAEGQSFWGALVWLCDLWDLEASPQRWAACASFDPEVPGV